LDKMTFALENDDFEGVRVLFKESVSGFAPQCGINDLLWTANKR